MSCAEIRIWQAMVRWLAVALVLLAGCAYADVAEPLVEPLSLLQDAPAGSKQDPGEQAAASVEAEAKKVEEEAAEMEKSDVAKDDSKASDAGAEVFIKADKPAAPAPAPPAKAEATPPAAADSIAETPKEANAVKAIVDAPSKASEQMNDEKQQTEYEVKLEKAMPTHPEQTQAAGGEAAQPEAQAAEDNSATAKYAHILNPAKQPTASEMQGYKRLKTKLDQRKRERMQRGKCCLAIALLRAAVTHLLLQTMIKHNASRCGHMLNLELLTLSLQQHKRSLLPCIRRWST